MELNEILSKCDHTLLAQTATWKEIQAICDDGMKYGCASVCIPASYVRQAAQYVEGKLPICTVIGFPNGYDTTAAKCFMASDAVDNGAEEVDMVINIGWVKDKKWDDLLSEIKAVKAACKGKLLKVIIECCFLTDEGGRGPVRKARGPRREDQGRRRHRRPEGRRGLHQPGRLPPGHQPHRQGRQGHGGLSHGHAPQ